MPRALILGGTGLIGRATARRLLTAGWRVDLTGRDPGHLPAGLAEAGARFTAVDRSDSAGLAHALAGGADLLVDCVCYTAADARLLLPLLADVAGTVMISARAVYVDAHGNHVNSDVPPRFEAPVTEAQPTVAPGDGDFRTREGYGANKVAAEHVLLDSGAPVTVVRPSRVHGPGATRPYTWVFVKRVLDRRPAVLLARRGHGAQMTAAANLAALIGTVAAAPGRRVLNCVDPDVPGALEVCRLVADRLGHTWREVLLGEDAEPGPGRTPWHAAYPFEQDMGAALALGHVPAGDFAATAVEEVDWLAAAARGGPDRRLLPAADDSGLVRYLDYALEDRYLAARPG